MTDQAAQAGGAEERTLYDHNPTMFRNHPLAFALSVLALIAGVVGAPVALGALEEPLRLWVAAGLGGVGAVAGISLLWWWVGTLGVRLTVTTRRTVLRRGLLSRHTNEVFHSNVRNVQIRQTFLQRLLSTGTLSIASAGQSSVEIEAHGLPHPEEVRELINTHRGA